MGVAPRHVKNSDHGLDRADAADARAFRDALGAFATGVAVATTLSAKATPVGITVNSFTSVSLVPPLVLISVGRSNLSFSQFQRCRHFAVNVLSAEQRGISQRFAVRAENKWRDIAVRAGAFGSPILDDALAVFECEVERRNKAGDHTILLGRIVAFNSRQNGEPLIFYRGAYNRLWDGDSDTEQEGSEKI